MNNLRDDKTIIVNDADKHNVKSARIRSFSVPYFPAFVLNTGKYGPEKLRIRTLFRQRRFR